MHSFPLVHFVADASLLAPCASLHLTRVHCACSLLPCFLPSCFAILVLAFYFGHSVFATVSSGVHIWQLVSTKADLCAFVAESYERKRMRPHLLGCAGVWLGDRPAPTLPNLSFVCFDRHEDVLWSYSHVFGVVRKWHNLGTSDDMCRLPPFFTESGTECSKSTDLLAIDECKLNGPAHATHILQQLSLCSLGCMHPLSLEFNRQSDALLAQNGPPTSNPARHSSLVTVPFCVDVHPRTFLLLHSLLSGAAMRICSLMSRVPVDYFDGSSPSLVEAVRSETAAAANVLFSSLPLLETNLRRLAYAQGELLFPEFSALLPQLRLCLESLLDLSRSRTGAALLASASPFATDTCNLLGHSCSDPNCSGRVWPGHGIMVLLRSAVIRCIVSALPLLYPGADDLARLIISELRAVVIMPTSSRSPHSPDPASLLLCEPTNHCASLLDALADSPHLVCLLDASALTYDRDNNKCFGCLETVLFALVDVVVHQNTRHLAELHALLFSSTNFGSPSPASEAASFMSMSSSRSAQTGPAGGTVPGNRSWCSPVRNTDSLAALRRLATLGPSSPPVHLLLKLQRFLLALVYARCQGEAELGAVDTLQDASGFAAVNQSSNVIVLSCCHMLHWLNFVPFWFP